MAKGVEDANTYRVGHPLAQRVLELGKALTTPPAKLAFAYTGSGKNIAVLEPLRGRSGWLACIRLTMSALETEDRLLFAGITDEGIALDEAQCRRFFDLPASQGNLCAPPGPVLTALNESLAHRRQELVEEIGARNSRWFDIEMDKLDRWAEDRRTSLRVALAELDEALKEAKKSARLAPTLPEKLERQRAIRVLESKRDEAWRAYDAASREIDRQKDALLDEISHRLEQRIQEEQLLVLRWTLV
jgi:hypothetical protein